MRIRCGPIVALTAVLVAAPMVSAPAADAQDVARLVRAAGDDGTVRFSYAARADVCSVDDNVRVRSSDGSTAVMRGMVRRETGTSACETGPVFMELQREAGRIASVTVRVARPPQRSGSTWTAVSAEDAASFLLSESTLRNASQDAAREIVFAGTLADTETWPKLLVLSRSGTLSADVRKTAIFWLGQEAGDRVVAGLVSVAGDDAEELAVRESAVFALSRIRDESSTDALMSIARTHSEPRIRRAAMFWLAQSGSPRAVSFFEEILRGGR